MFSMSNNDGLQMNRNSETQSKVQASKEPMKRLCTKDLLQDANTLIIEHNGNDYTLRVTRNDKLILTK